MRNIKNWILAIITALFIFLTVTLGIQGKVIHITKQQLENTEINFKALEDEYNKVNDKNIEFKLTVSQLQLSRDSITHQLNETRNKLGIKDKEIKRLQYLASVASRIDTLYIRDSIFINGVNIDTTIQDGKWYKCNLHLESPNIVSVNPEFTSEKQVFTYTRKEILNPNKCKFLRLFQKKSTIIETEVVENNPYIVSTKERFMEVIK